MQGQGEAERSKCNSFQHHGQSKEPGLLISVSLKQLHANWCEIIRVTRQFEAKVILVTMSSQLT